MLFSKTLQINYLYKSTNEQGLRMYRLSKFALSLSLTIISPVSAEVFFNPSFLSDDPESVADLARFARDEGQAPGHYQVELFVNNEFFSNQDILFNVRRTGRKDRGDDSGLDACITGKHIKKLGINTQKIPSLKYIQREKCVNLEDIIPQYSSRFDFDNQRLYISIPQALLKNNARGYIPPDEWSEGINAFLVNYNFTGSNTRKDSSKERQINYFLSLWSGLNLGAWRLRNYSTWNYSNIDSGNGKQWENISTYIQRTIIPFKTALILGESYTPGDIFDGIGFRGVQISSDDNMLPDSLRGFAPVVRGIANSDARVTIRQNGYVIYQTYVSPGEFEISDLYSTSSSGDLQVTVSESNGTDNTFSVPYSSVPVLQREGRIKYALTMGQYRSNNSYQNTPSFAQGTFSWGLPAGLTIYGGTQLANNYKSLAFGSGMNFGLWGAISADITQAKSVLADKSHHQGQSLRFLYAKSLNEYGTNFQLLGYRYSTQGFYTLDETSYRQMSGYTTDTHDEIVHGAPKYRDYYNLNYTRKGRIQVNLTQQMGTSGSLFLTGSHQTYWHTNETTDLWQVGYSALWKDITYNITYSYNKSTGYSDADRRLALNVSLPVGKWLSKGGKNADITNSNNTAYLTYAASTDTHGHMSQQAGVSGSLLKNSNLHYSVMQGYGSHGIGSSGSANLNYQGRYGNSNIGYNYSNGYRQVNYGLSGGVVGHANGITLSQPLGDTNILVKAPGAEGVNIENVTGVSTDWRGYAVVPYATTYRLNRIALDITTLKDNAELDDTVVNVVPTQGAIVKAEFKTRIGLKILMTLVRPNEKPVPFGATVSSHDGKFGSLVGENGQVYLSGLSTEGNLNVKWGNNTNQSCNVHFSLPKENTTKPIIHYKSVCY
ncbi:outer membrane usher protein FimD [Salmonella enterica subsp. enterica serovar Berlin]|nr:outer membrane usher protein FimD [Salmonella enterica]EBY0806367.1 outer membrane usher protein FimD [Salmonella enterica subsp. enterica serovar Berlin]